MNADAVRRAVAAATAQAFALGQSMTHRGNASQRATDEMRRAALQYAEQLVLPVVEMAIEESIEAAASTMMRERGSGAETA